MADLDKTIKGLECCSIAICPQILDYGKSDKGCPYHAEENCVELLAKDALELLKEKQPKLLTLKETINAKYPTDVFCEIKGEERIFAVTAPVLAQWIGKPDIRYWTARPTDEQRNAEPWKDGEQE